MRAIRRGLLLAVVPLLLGAPLAAEPAKGPIPVRADEMHPLTFTLLVVNLTKEFEIAIVPDKFGLPILEALRKAGYNVVGAENVLFAVDKSHEARLLLGGTIIDIVRHRNLPGAVDLCDVAIRWELFDRVADQVVYKKLTRARTAIGKGKPATEGTLNALVKGALASLLASPNFVAAARRSPGAEPAASAPATYRACSALPRALPTEIDAVIAATAALPAGGGAGVFVSPDGVLLTAAHVVAGLDEIAVKLRDGRSLPGRIVRRDPERDVAIVRVAGAPEACVPIAAGWPAVGDELFAIGAPVREELAFSVSRGIASGTPTVDGRKVIQTDASVSPGNSGGPLLDAEGRLVGVVAAKTVGVAVEGIGFAVHADTAMAWLGLSPGDATTLGAAGDSGATAPRAVYEDAADGVPVSPLAQVQEWNAAKKVAEDARAREERPAIVAVAFGTLLTVGSFFPMLSGVFLAMEEGNQSNKIICWTTGFVSLAGGITLIAVGAHSLRELRQARALKPRVAFGIAPLDGGRGFGLVLGARF